MSKFQVFIHALRPSCRSKERKLLRHYFQISYGSGNKRRLHPWPRPCGRHPLSFQAPEAVLGLAGLAAGAVSVKRRRQSQRRMRLYRSKRRLERLEEGVRELPKSIIDIMPAGSRRTIYPALVKLILLANDAALKGYAVEEPEWLTKVRQYYALLGPATSPPKTLVVSDYEAVKL